MMIVLGEFPDPIRAGIVQMMLKANGIDAVLLDEGASAWTAGRLLVPIRLLVPGDQVEEAEALIRGTSGKAADPSSIEPGSE